MEIMSSSCKILMDYYKSAVMHIQKARVLASYINHVSIFKRNAKIIVPTGFALKW